MFAFCILNFALHRISRTSAASSRPAKQHPNADTELHYRNAYELLVATILSAQSTDARVNMVTPALFARYPDARALAQATAAELEPQIVSTGFFRQKSKALIGMAQKLVAEHGGEVPAEMDKLVALPGVGRKTANVVLGHALGVPGLPVDRHVLRVSNRIGIASSDDPEQVERQLTRRCHPRCGRWHPTFRFCTVAGSAARSRCATGARSGRIVITIAVLGRLAGRSQGKIGRPQSSSAQGPA